MLISAEQIDAFEERLRRNSMLNVEGGRPGLCESRIKPCHPFSGRYKALLVDGSGTGYLKTVCDYVHLNPIRGGLLKADERLLSYPWSSLMWYLAVPDHRPKWIRTDRLLGEPGIGHDTSTGRQEFERRMEARRLEETDPEALRAVRRGWCLGSEEFKREMLERVDGKLGENHSGELRQQTARQKAERIIAEELDRLKWQESELARRRKCDPDKLAVAARLRTETTLTIKAIAERLHLGTPMNARVRLHGWMRNEGEVAGTQSGKVRVPNQVNVTV